jgi:transglutaminase-like putative cysteine protease
MKKLGQTQISDSPTSTSPPPAASASPQVYVSGYLITAPPPGQPRLVGADAMHACGSVQVPGFGWID